MSAINFVFDLLRSDKLSRQTLARGSVAKQANDVHVRSHRLLVDGYVEATGLSQIYVKCEYPLNVEIVLPVMLPGLIPADGTVTINSDDALVVNQDVTTAPIEIVGFLALPFGCKLKITNIKGSPSSDGGVNLVIIHD